GRGSSRLPIVRDEGWAPTLPASVWPRRPNSVTGGRMEFLTGTGGHRHHFDRHESGRCALLQPARDGGAADQGRQDRDALDPALPSPLPANEARLLLGGICYNLGNPLRRLAAPGARQAWRLTTGGLLVDPLGASPDSSPKAPCLGGLW